MLSFHEGYHPLTSRPYLADDTYIEYQACEALRPYIACYWVMDGSKTMKQTERSEVLVIPDTCMDIIIRVNHTRQTIVGVLSGIHDLFNSIGQMLSVPGRAAVKDICAYSCVSHRQMERLFLQYVGLPMKRIFRLVRYQNVWHDMAMSNTFDIQDAVYRYGYTDQAHLSKEFKSFHGVTLTKARRIAEMNR